MVIQLIAAYNRALNSRPLITKSISTFFIIGAGDAVSQYIESRLQSKSFLQNFDHKRCFKLSCYGAFYLAPLLHGWYGFLAKTFPAPGTLSTIKKLSLDQTFFCSWCIWSFFTAATLFNGGTLQQAQEKIKKDYWEALVVNWKIWPPVMLINFSIIPLHTQVIFVNFVAVFWNAYLSYLSNYKK
ncbi:unnamed protein product [Blepharisma stoltei]|uniref:Uncharacterized protein n=1 Tax=Blepharisma stoltei TaxID=1481888 RepID=A0AAU9K5V3_9CILI|nr:unnamed protein product [Blepharisma stoltei]